MNPPKIEFKIHIETQRRGQKRAVKGEKPAEVTPGRLPRITRLMALAIRFQSLIDSGEVKDQADIARLGLVTRARITQIMNLNLLAPDIQSAILDLPPVTKGRDPISERDLRPIDAIVDWAKQRGEWRGIDAG